MPDVFLASGSYVNKGPLWACSKINVNCDGVPRCVIHTNFQDNGSQRERKIPF